ncbi:MAG: hypothetical protein M3Z03_05600, partial [Actinomycetota bacterium]|nr:hypothetical protein [Actinomycetota bacterium]
GGTVAIAATVGLGAWVAAEALLDREPGRMADVLACAALGLAGAVAVVAGYRLVGLQRRLTGRTAVEAAA